MLKDTLKKDLITAMKAKDLLKVSVLRYLLSKVGEREIELRTEEKEITEEDVAKIIKRLIKQRGQSIEGFEKVGNLEKVQQEKDEREILETYFKTTELGKNITSHE